MYNPPLITVYIHINYLYYTLKGLSDDLMQSIAAEMNLSETAFVQKLPSSFSMEAGD